MDARFVKGETGRASGWQLTVDGQRLEASRDHDSRAARWWWPFSLLGPSTANRQR